MASLPMSTAAGLLARGRSALMQTVAQWQLGAPTSQLWHAVGGAGSVASFHTTQPCEARLRMRGTVVSDKAQKSVVVAVERIYKHPVVKKSVKVRNKFMAHDELDQYKVGDEIWIEEHRPISRRKRFMATGFVDPTKQAQEVPSQP